MGTLLSFLEVLSRWYGVQDALDAVRRAGRSLPSGRRTGPMDGLDLDLDQRGKRAA